MRIAGLELEEDALAGASPFVISEFDLHVQTLVLDARDLEALLISASDARCYLKSEQLSLAPYVKRDAFVLLE
jgi:hypothetical protein